MGTFLFDLMARKNMQTAGAAKAGKVKWEFLLGLSSLELWRGTVFRISAAKWPYEETVDLMLVENHHAPSGLSLMVCTGYKAGCTLVHLPVEANFRVDACSLSTVWLKANWNRWVYTESPVNQVQVIPNYPSNVCIDHGEVFTSRDLLL